MAPGAIARGLAAAMVRAAVGVSDATDPESGTVRPPGQPPAPDPSLSEFAAALGTAGTVADVTRLACEHAVRVLGATHVLVVTDGDDGARADPNPDGAADGDDDALVGLVAAARRERRTQVSAGRRHDDAAAEAPVGRAPAVAAPLLSDHRVLGALGVRMPDDRAADVRVVAAIETIGALCVLAVLRIEAARERAASLREISQAQADADKARRDLAVVQERLAFLDDASSVLGQDLDLRSMMDRLARLVVPRLGDWCTVFLAPSDGLAHPIAVAHDDRDRQAEIEAVFQRWGIRLDVEEGIGAVLSTGRPKLHRPVDDRVLRHVAFDDGHFQALRSLRLGSIAVLPITAKDRVLGAIALHTERGRALRDADVALAQELAARAAAPILNARDHEHRGRMLLGLQKGLLPPRLPGIPGVELAADHVAAGEGLAVGGDFYDAFMLEEDHWLVAVGDVRGRGVHAAAVTGLARATIRSAAWHGHTLTKVLDTLNRMLLDTEHDYHDEPVSVPRFCTAVLVALKRTSSGSVRATVCAAGHPLPYLVSSDGTIEQVGRPGTLLGAIPELELHESLIELRDGDALVVVTDGILERRDRYGRFFDERILETLRAAAGGPADVVVRRLLTDVEAFADSRIEDDMAALVLCAAP